MLSNQIEAAGCQLLARPRAPTHRLHKSASSLLQAAVPPPQIGLICATQPMTSEEGWLSIAAARRAIIKSSPHRWPSRARLSFHGVNVIGSDHAPFV